MTSESYNGRPFWRDPAWLSLFIAILFHLCVAAYLYGRMADKVDMLEQNDQMILQHLLLEHSGGAAR